MAVLLLDSDLNRRKVVVEALERSGPASEIEAAASMSEAKRRLSEDAYDVILDCGQPEEDRLAMLRNIQQGGQPTQVIVVTDEGGEEEARRAMQEGASDYIVRTEAYLTALPLVIEKAYQRCRLLAELQPLGHTQGKPRSGERSPQGPVDSSEALRNALTRMQRALEEVNALLEKSQGRLDDPAAPRPLDKLGTRQAQDDASSGRRQASDLEQVAAEAHRQARDMSTLMTSAMAFSLIQVPCCSIQALAVAHEQNPGGLGGTTD